MSNTLYSKSMKNSDHDDIWDDSLLIKAYEESVKLQNEEIAKMIAMETNKTKKSDDPESKSNSVTSETYKIGDFVRSTYKDGVDYEAEIISINENRTALIRYVGYGNEERVKCEDLTKSWGETHREQQKIDAENENIAAAIGTNSNDSIKSQEDLHRFVVNKSRNLQEKLPIPPMPPMPPSMFQNSKDAEYMSAMLMSWYMSGYYTGLYQGRKELKEEIISNEGDCKLSKEENLKHDRKRQRKQNLKVISRKMLFIIRCTLFILIVSIIV